MKGEMYYYYYLVDGEKRYSPDCSTVALDDDSIINCIIIPSKIYKIIKKPK